MNYSNKNDIVVNSIPTYIIKCNTFLRRSNNSRNGNIIKTIGKWFLEKVIINHFQINILRRESEIGDNTILVPVILREKETSYKETNEPSFHYRRATHNI